VLVAFALRFGLMLYFHHVSLVPRLEYLPVGYETGRVARALAAGEGFSSPLNVDTGPTAWFTPVYPMILAEVFKVFGIYSYRSFVVIQAVNCAVSALVCLPVVLIGRRVFSAAVGTAAAWLWALLPSATMFAIQWVWDTSLSALLLAVLVLATLAVRETPRAAAWAGYGALWALAALTNPSLFSLLPFLLGWAAWRAQAAGMRWVRLATLSAAVFVAGMAPWVVRNYIAFGEFIPFRSNFGLEFYLGNNEHVPDTWAWWLHPNDNDEERARFLELGEIAYMKDKQRQAVAFIRSHPGDTARFLWRRFVQNWTGAWDPLVDVWPGAPWYLRLNYVGNVLFSVLALAGAALSLRTRREEGLLFAAVLMIFPVVYYLTHTALRYRHAMDPAMALLAVFAVAHAFSRVARRWRAVPLAAARVGRPAAPREDLVR
jgi:4-amino-4-deoxy-L-arabinose transferase-like glycosyltransferase